MKSLLLALALVTAAACSASDKPAPKTSAPAAPAALTGQVLEVKDTEMYTYLRLKTRDGETWTAVNKAQVAKGQDVTIDNPIVMTHFESKALNRNFDRLVLGTLHGSAAALPPGGPGHGAPSGTADLGNVKVAKAGGRDAKTIAEIVTQRAKLKDKNVAVRGKVVKFTGGVLGRNWIHIKDGSGKAADHSDDLVLTTKDEAKLGDVVVAKGVVRVDKDLGSGYVYRVMVEDAKLQK